MKRADLMRSKADSTFFAPMGCAFLTVAVAGFGPSFLVPLTLGESQFRPALLLYAIVMFAWLGTYILQSLLPSAGKIHMHVRIGYAAIALFVAVWLSSITISISAFASPLPPAIRPLINNIFFLQIVAWVLSPTLFLLAMRARKTSSADHKRYMFLLTFFLVEAAASRLGWLPGMSNDEYWIVFQYLYLDVFPLALVMFDLWSFGRLARATVAGLAILLPYQVIVVLIWDSDLWLGIAERLLEFLSTS